MKVKFGNYLELKYFKREISFYDYDLPLAHFVY